MSTRQFVLFSFCEVDMRLQFEMTEERVKEIDELIDRLGLKTRVNLLNEALTFYEWAVREREAGRIIASVDEEEDKYKEVELPGFPTITKTQEVAEKIKDKIKEMVGNLDENSTQPILETADMLGFVFLDGLGQTYALTKAGLSKLPGEAGNIAIVGEDEAIELLEKALRKDLEEEQTFTFTFPTLESLEKAKKSLTLETLEKAKKFFPKDALRALEPLEKALRKDLEEEQTFLAKLRALLIEEQARLAKEPSGVLLSVSGDIGGESEGTEDEDWQQIAPAN
jgi:hypothetical protein